jgi:acetyltransferase-like isoleucine patch superfamily enzyme
MFDFLALITNKHYWKLHSIIIKSIMKLYGVKVGKNFYCEATPKLKLKGKASNIIIGENVKFLGEVDLRNRENGRIILRDNSSLEAGVRLVAAREGIIDIGEDTSIGPHTIINGGGNVVIGKKCLFAKNISINANDHIYDKILPIKEQGFIHKDVLIEDDVWLGANVCVNKGIIIKKGSVVGANAVVTKNTFEYSISAGVPAKQLSFRG